MITLIEMMRRSRISKGKGMFHLFSFSKLPDVGLAAR
jgi:hypothetical protein